VVTRWATLDVSSTRQLAPRDLVGPGPAVRPGGSGLADDASEERTGLCSFRVDVLFKSPPVPQRLLGSSRGPITSDRSVAGWRPLSVSLHRPAVLHGTAGWLRSELRLPSAGLEPWLQAPVSSALSKRTPRRTQTGLAWRSACLFMGSVGEV